MRIALSGSAYSGKTAIAQALSINGFWRVDYTGYIKEQAGRALQTITGKPVTREMMEANKRDYRTFLQTVGVLAKFNEGFGIEDSLTPAFLANAEHVVFDNVRFQDQMDILVEHDFTLVTVDASLATRAQRAYETHGLSLREFEEMSGHVGETSYPIGAIRIDGERFLNEIIQDILRLANIKPIALPILIDSQEEMVLSHATGPQRDSTD